MQRIHLPNYVPGVQAGCQSNAPGFQASTLSYLLLRKVPRFPIAVRFPRNLHRNWDGPLKYLQMIFAESR